MRWVRVTCHSREVSKKGVSVDGSVNVSRKEREKPGVARYCVRPGVVNAASKSGSPGCVVYVRPATFIRPFSATFSRQASNSATIKMLYTQP